jgi:hypothetical protein
LAFVSVFILVAHFILLAYLRFRTAYRVKKSHGAGPRCHVEQDFDPPTWGLTVDCPHCKNQLKLTGLTKPATGGSRAGGSGAGEEGR